MVEEKVTEAIIDVGKNVAEDIVRPTSKSIGENLGLLVDGVMGWLGYWGQKQEIKRKAYLADFKKKIAEKVAGIPEEKLNEPKIRIVGPAIEASKFYIEEAEFRELFAELVASACDADCVNKVHPAFPEMIKQLSYLDIKLLEVFRQTHTLPCCTINETHKDGKVTPYPHIMFDFKGVKHSFDQSKELQLTQSVENLERLGLLIKNSNVIELDYDYEKFRNHWFYKALGSVFEAESKINMKKYRIELTQMGQAFVSCCFEKQNAESDSQKQRTT